MMQEGSIRTDSLPAEKMVDHLFRSQAGQMVASLTRLLGPARLDLAEEIVQESLLKALQIWPYSGLPDNPAGWLFRVARNTALDRLRHGAMADAKSTQIAADQLRRSLQGDITDVELEERLRDDELRMVLMCCHPGLPRDARVALSLKTVGGFSTREIAKALLSDEAAIAQRLFRAKRQIRDEGIHFELPKGPELAERLDAALEVIYLMFNEGYAAQSGEDLIRQELCGEALRLGQLLAGSSVATPMVHALVALIALQAARLPARVDSTGDLILLDDQDRSLWDRNLLALGFHHFSASAEGENLTHYHVEAAIAATHAGAATANATDWNTILGLYDQLFQIRPSAIVALNRVVAVSRVQGTAAALAALQPLLDDRSLRHYYLLPAVQGHVLLDAGDTHSAAQCFQQALSLPCSDPERRFLQRKLAECAVTPRH